MRNTIKHKPVTNAELKKLRQYGKNDYIELILMTGLRRNEVLNAIKAFDYSKDYIDIRTKKSGDFKDRIYLNKNAHTIMERLSRRKLSNVQTIYKSITRHTKAALGYTIAPHSFRAYFATSLLNSGVDLVTVSTLMNHKKLSTTAMYIAVNENGLRNALNTIDTTSTTSLEGMSEWELRKEVLKLRERLTRMQNQKYQTIYGDE